MDQDVKGLLKLLAFLVLVIGAIGVVSYILFGGFSVDQVRSYIEQYGRLSPLIFLGVTILFVVFPPAPNDLMAIAAGILFGFWKGLGLTIVAFLIGSMIAYGIGRKTGRPLMKRLMPNKAGEYTEIFKKHGAVSVMISRMVPVISFDVVSYVAGIFKLHPTKFALATFIGMLPNTFLLVKIGDAVFAKSEFIFLYVGIMIAISLTGIYVFKRYRNELTRMTNIFL